MKKMSDCALPQKIVPIRMNGRRLPRGEPHLLRRDRLSEKENCFEGTGEEGNLRITNCSDDWLYNESTDWSSSCKDYICGRFT
jgi:hypothetical protein